MAPKRHQDRLKLKSIWDQELVLKILSEKHAIKMWLWLIRNPESKICDLPFTSWSVSEMAKTRLVTEFVKFTTTISTSFESLRGDTVKLLVELQDGHKIETVIMKHSNRNTVCVSSQVGCQMGCRFCATGTMGIIGDLSHAEIIEQLVHANYAAKIRNVVFMGMGEPLNNFKNVKLAAQFMINNKLFALSPRHVTVSTVGVTKNMYRLTDELPMVNLALSLHAPNQEVRAKIVPASGLSKFDKLIDAVDYHIQKNFSASAVNEQLYRGGVMIEYILIKNVNDLEEHAHELGALLFPRRNHILLNLIPYNPTEVAENYEAPTAEAVEAFKEICCSAQYNIHTRIRREFGQDIAGACGQLALTNTAKPAGGAVSKDIEDTLSSSTRSSSGIRQQRKQNSNPEAVAADAGNSPAGKALQAPWWGGYSVAITVASVVVVAALCFQRIRFRRS